MIQRQGRGPRMLGMMGIVLACAVGFSAIKSPSVLAGYAVMCVCFASLAVATLGAIFCTPRAFWAGFAVVGWSSLLLSSGFWVDDSEAPLVFFAALYRTFDANSYFRQFSRLEREFRVPYPMSRQILLAQFAIVQAMLGGLIALGVTRRFRDGRTIGERLGRRSSIAIGVMSSVGLTLAALRFPDSFISTLFLQCVYILLFGLLLASVLGSRRMFCICAFLGAMLTIWLLSHEGWIYGRDNYTVENGLIKEIHQSLYPRDFNDDNLVKIAPVTFGTMNWRAMILGNASYGTRMTRAGVVTTPWSFRYPPKEFWELPQHRHMVLFCLVAIHVFALFAALLAGFAWRIFLGWFRRLCFPNPSTST